jgi:hypothetical protein
MSGHVLNKDPENLGATCMHNTAKMLHAKGQGGCGLENTPGEGTGSKIKPLALANRHLTPEWPLRYLFKI